MDDGRGIKVEVRSLIFRVFSIRRRCLRVTEGLFRTVSSTWELVGFWVRFRSCGFVKVFRFRSIRLGVEKCSRCWSSRDLSIVIFFRVLVVVIFIWEDRDREFRR